MTRSRPRRCCTCAKLVSDDDPWDARRCRDCALARFARKRARAAPVVRSAGYDGSAPLVAVRVVTREELARRLAADDARLERARERADAARTAAGGDRGGHRCGGGPARRAGGAGEADDGPAEGPHGILTS